MVVQREPINVVAEVSVGVLAEVRFVESGAVGKDVIDLTLIDLTCVGEPILERDVPQTAGVRQEILNRDLVRYLILKFYVWSVFRDRVSQLDFAFLIQHRGRQRRKRLGRRGDVIQGVDV